jgi:hypothetical protein
VDYDAWLIYTASLTRTPGGTAMWPHIEEVLTPTIVDLINERLDQHPEELSMIQLVTLFRINGSRDGIA